MAIEGSEDSSKLATLLGAAAPGAEGLCSLGTLEGRWVRRAGLGELKACVHADGIAQFLSEDAFLAVVGQLEQVEASGRGGQPSTWLPLADGEEAPEDTAQGIPSVLQAHTTAVAQKVPM